MNTSLGLYVGIIRRQHYGHHDIHLNHLDPDGNTFIDGTPPGTNSTAHILSMLNEYIWVDDDMDELPTRNNVTIDPEIPTHLFANRYISQHSELTVSYGADYDWDHVKWTLVSNIIKVIREALAEYEQRCNIVPARWYDLLDRVEIPHERISLPEQAYKLYRTLPTINQTSSQATST
jgi:hypothetical protein